MDVEKLREDTPGCGGVIHLNNAGAGLMPRPVLGAIVEHLELEAHIGGYEAADRRAEAVDDAYRAVGALIGAPPENVAIMENATAAFNMALSSVPFRAGDVLLTTRNDYVSNQIAYLALEARFGIQVLRAPDRREGGVDPAAMAELVHKKRPRLVAVTHIPTSSGLVQPVEAIGEACRERNVLYLVDACQSLGQRPLDVERIGCDFLSATARKFLRGPRGVGFLYVSERALEMGLEPLFPDLRGADWIEADLYQPLPDARRFENWEFAYALVLGLGAAARYAGALGIDAIHQRLDVLSRALRERATAVADVEVADHGAELGAIVALGLGPYDVRDVSRRLRARGVNTSVTTRGYAVLDLDDKGLEATLRVSPHVYTTLEEIEAFAELLDELLHPSLESP